MIVIDAPAWVDDLRDTGSPMCIAVGEWPGAEFATCDVVRMELLAGARDEPHGHDLRRFIAHGALVPMQPSDYDQEDAL